MKDKQPNGFHKILIPICIATLLAFAALFYFDVWSSADLSCQDLLYQKAQVTSGDIVIVGIDERAMDELGPYTEWGRDIIAATIDTLNVSEDVRPAAIGVDVLYLGENDPEADAYLAEVAGRYGNVVTACAAEFGSGVVDDTLDTFAILNFSEPFEALRQGTTQGHINAMFDTDGVFRHPLLTIKPDGREVPSMPLAIAEMVGNVTRPETDARGFWYLPFTGLPGAYDEGISVIDVLYGNVPADYFDDKIVLIGPYAAALQDDVITSIDHAKPMYGIEVQANVIQALLTGDYKQEAPIWPQLLLIPILVGACMILFLRKKVSLALIVYIICTAGYIGVCKVLYGQGIILRVLYIPVFLTVVFVGCIGFHYIQSAIEKRRVTNTFKRYVAPEVVNEILKEGTEALGLGGKLTRIAVLFVDVRGFTTMSEALTPPEVVAILNDYLTLIADCIIKNHGTLDKFVGDAAMAFWGAPLPQEDYVMNALKAADDMRKGSEELSKVLLEKYGRSVSFGIGVNVGDAVVGNMGSPMRMDYTAIGDTVNTAARLEANAPGGTIYISRAVADELEGRIRTTSLGATIKLKGKKEGFEILVLDEILE